ncbi:MAG: hypothetical protein WCR72_01380 [Bacteroidota bacterium]
MGKALSLALLILISGYTAKTQNVVPAFDTIEFNRKLELANWLTEYDYFSQLSTVNLSRQEEYTGLQWFSFTQEHLWHTIGGKIAGEKFSILKHVVIDSMLNISDYHGHSDTSALLASGYALSQADAHFQTVRDTSNIYFTSFVHRNTDQSISIWFLPAFQPSGQAIYGCEWEYLFDSTGKNLLKQFTYSENITGLWIGQPRELRMNYRNSDTPTLGSLFFALSFCDYFTRVRIDTNKSFSILTKDKAGKYTWSHELRQGF